MTVVQTLLVFVAIPGAIITLTTLAVYGKSIIRQPNRYRPGRPWAFAPNWYVPHPDAVLRRESTHRELPAGATAATTAVGGASGEW